MLRPGALIIFILSIPLLNSLLYGRDRDTGFLNRLVKVGSSTYRYQVYLPVNWKKNQKWPVLLFLHGAGERGEDGLIQTEVGIGTAIRHHQDRFPCIVVFPQCRKEVWWTAPEMEYQALKALEQTILEFKGDRRRVYLTGLSMGGYGTWSIASKYPDRFAALAPICGGLRHRDDPASDLAPYLETAAKIGKLPSLGVPWLWRHYCSSVRIPKNGGGFEVRRWRGQIQ